jgi:hypothetical protein
MKKLALGILGSFLLAVALTGVYDIATGQPIGTTTLALTPGSSTVAPAIRATGAPANISINLVPKGTGTVQVAGVPIVTGGGTTTSLTVNPGPLNVTGTTNLTGPLFSIPGTAAGLEQVGGLVLANSGTNATTTLVATEQDLFTYTLPANGLSADNQFLFLQFKDRNAATGNTKQLRVYFGATLIGDSTAVAANNNWWSGDCVIWRTGAATQKAVCNALNSANAASWSTGAGGGSNVSTPAEVLSGPVVVRITGTDGVAAGGTNLEGVNLLWYPAGQ